MVPSSCFNGKLRNGSLNCPRILLTEAGSHESGRRKVRKLARMQLQPEAKIGTNE